MGPLRASHKGRLHMLSTQTFLPPSQSETRRTLQLLHCPSNALQLQIHSAQTIHTARNGACNICTAPPLHPMQMTAPWQRTEEIGCGALKHATIAAFFSPTFCSG